MAARQVRWLLAVFTLTPMSACAPAPTAPLAGPATVEAQAAEPIPEIPDDLKLRLEMAIEQVRARQLLTTNAFWTIFHGILGLGPGMTVMHPESGTRVNALGYIFGGDYQYGEVRGMRFIPTRWGLDVQTGPTFIGQGHQDQFIAEIAQWGVSINTPVVVHGKQYTLNDFVNEIKAHSRVKKGQELSWSIVVLSHYIGTDFTWTNGHGEKLHFNDIVRDELDASIDNAACGGTHRLFGLTWAYFWHLRRGGKPTDTIWPEVVAKLNKHRDMARQYQNPDGSFSSSYFRGPGTTEDPKERLGSAGHILEWLATYISDEELNEPWMKDGAAAVAKMFLEIRDAPMESGALYHAAHGLVTYYRRVYGWEKFRNEPDPSSPKPNLSAAGKPAVVR